ncbi:MAG: DNA-processing protein DprA [Flavonifractor plautii]
MSEYRHTPQGQHFPVRNRLISGLSLGVVAVECARFSGTMKTIEHAMDQDRDIFAVPGISTPQERGPQLAPPAGGPPGDLHPGHPGGVLAPFPQKLAQSAPLPPEAARGGWVAPEPEGAETGPEEERGSAPGGPKDGAQTWSGSAGAALPFTDDQLTLLRAMAGRKKTSTADELVEETQIPARRVLSALTMLQVDGAAREHPGKRFSPLVELEE